MNPLSNPCPNCKATAGNFCEFPDERSGGGFSKQANRFHAERSTDVVVAAIDVQAQLQGSHAKLCAKAIDHSATCNCHLAGNYVPGSLAKPDPINPSHYKGDLVMRIIEHFELDKDFPLGNVIKYILRSKNKAGLEDLKKARWYLDRRIAQLEGSLKKEPLL